MRRLILMLVLASSLGACGVKNDLLKPNGDPTAKGENDPSKPPQPLGR